MTYTDDEAVGARSTRSADVQLKALRYVRDCITRQGFPPTVREIGTAIGYRSPSSAALVVDGMVRRGWLSTEPGRARTMRITDEGMAAVADG